MSETQFPDPQRDGWNYKSKPADGTDARKLVTLREDAMTWVGIRVWNGLTQKWMNNNEPERAQIIAWKNLDEPARGFYEHGLLYIVDLKRP